MSNGGGGLKKRLCNPPVEQVAANGDPEVYGLFIGAGRAVEVLEDSHLKQWYVDNVVAVEAAYLDERKECAEKARKAMRELERELLERSSAV